MSIKPSASRTSEAQIATFVEGISSLPEAEITVSCTRSSDAPAGKLGPGAQRDWKKILDYAQFHGVLQFLAAGLARAGITPPEPFREILNRQQQRNAALAMLQHRECSLIIGALAKAGIPAVAFKGTTLSKLLYGRVADRISSDVDILIPQTQLSRAQTVLESLGYVIADTISRLETAALLSSGNEMVYVNAQSGVLVELHWRLFETDRACGFTTDFESLHIVEGGIENEDMFLILALHGLAHHWEAMKWVVDIDAFVRNVAVNWDVVFERAAAYGTSRAANVAILLAHGLFDTPLPRPITDATSHRLTRRYLRCLLTPHRIPPVVDLWMQIAARERWIDRLRFIKFVAHLKPWDHMAGGHKRLSRLIRLLKESFRGTRLAAVQTIPELEPPAGQPTPTAVNDATRHS